MKEFVFRVRGGSFHANTIRELMDQIKMDVIMARENEEILNAVSMVDVVEKIGSIPKP
jgi:hypothetical protein